MFVNKINPLSIPKGPQLPYLFLCTEWLTMRSGYFALSTQLCYTPSGGGQNQIWNSNRSHYLFCGALGYNLLRSRWVLTFNVCVLEDREFLVRDTSESSSAR